MCNSISTYVHVHVDIAIHVHDPCNYCSIAFVMIHFIWFCMSLLPGDVISIICPLLSTIIPLSLSLYYMYMCFYCDGIIVHVQTCVYYCTLLWIHHKFTYSLLYMFSLSLSVVFSLIIVLSSFWFYIISPLCM